MTSLSIDQLADAAPPIDMLEHYFREHNWDCERDSEDEIMATVKGSWSDYELRGLWRSDDQVLQFIAMTGISAAATLDRGALHELIGLINEQLWIGHFELWSSDGAILFRHAVLLDCEEEAALSMPQAHALVDAAIEECERYYPAFQFVLWGGKTPREALASALTETEGEA
jgi:hypothetical protein